MEQAGADALELNVYYIATDADLSGAEVEQRYVDLAREVKASVKIPVSIKIGHFFSSIPSIARQLDRAGADGLVLFNRFYQPDIDLENLEVLANVSLSGSYELRLRLRWAAILYGHLRADLALTGGVHTAHDVLKAMMVGAKVAQIASALLEHGIGHLSAMLFDLQTWMEQHEYHSIRQMQGSMSYRSVADPAAFERANYMKVLNAFEAPRRLGDRPRTTSRPGGRLVAFFIRTVPAPTIDARRLRVVLSPRRPSALRAPLRRRHADRHRLTGQRAGGAWRAIILAEGGER